MISYIMLCMLQSARMTETVHKQRFVYIYITTKISSKTNRTEFCLSVHSLKITKIISLLFVCVTFRRKYTTQLNY